jgi:hypothetical protein
MVYLPSHTELHRPVSELPEILSFFHTSKAQSPTRLPETHNQRKIWRPAGRTAQNQISVIAGEH